MVEFSTALPYLGAIAILTNADLPLVGWLPILVGYNIVFVLPPLALLLAYRLFGAPLEWRFGALQAGLQRGTREAMLWIFGLVGFGLLANSLSRMFALA